MPEIGRTLETHRQLALTVASMVATARAGNWAPLAALDAQCAQLFDDLRRLDPQDAAAADRVEILMLAQQVRAGQQELEDLLRPQFLQLAAVMAQLWEPQQPGA